MSMGTVSNFSETIPLIIKWLRWCLLYGNLLSVIVILLFSCWVISDSLWPHGMQHTRLPCPSLSSRICSNSCPLNQWCCLPILSSVIPFSFCLQFFLALGSFPVSQLFTSGGWSIGASASTSVLPKNIQSWLPLGLTGLISLLSKELSSMIIWRHQFLSLFYGPNLTCVHDYWETTGKELWLHGLCWQSEISAF